MLALSDSQGYIYEPEGMSKEQLEQVGGGGGGDSGGAPGWRVELVSRRCVLLRCTAAALHLCLLRSRKYRSSPACPRRSCSLAQVARTHRIRWLRPVTARFTLASMQALQVMQIKSSHDGRLTQYTSPTGQYFGDRCGAAAMGCTCRLRGRLLGWQLLRTRCSAGPAPPRALDEPTPGRAHA